MLFEILAPSHASLGASLEPQKDRPEPPPTHQHLTTSTAV